jgi:hypothetical protein
MRAQLTQVLVQRTTPDSRTAALVSLLYALKSEQRIVDPKEHGLTRKELQTRAKEISTGDWASEAVRQAIEAMTAAVVASMTAAVVASTTAAVVASTTAATAG